MVVIYSSVFTTKINKCQNFKKYGSSLEENERKNKMEKIYFFMTHEKLRKNRSINLEDEILYSFR